MRILHVNHHGGPLGGVEAYISDVERALTAHGHVSMLLYSSDVPEQTILSDARRHAFPDWPAPAGRPGDVLDTCIDAFMPDLAYVHAVEHPGLIERLVQRLPTQVYAHSPSMVCPGSAQYLRRSERVCRRTHGLGCMVQAQREGCCWSRNPSRHLRLIARCRAFVEALRDVDRVLVGSRFMRALMVRGGVPAERIEILAPVLLGISGIEPRPGPDTGVVLFAGRIVEEKGLVDLIRALATVLPPWSLEVAGDGPGRAEAEVLAARFGVADRVHFRGWLAPREMYRALEGCDIVAVPSKWPEPFGRIGAEAARHGRPVVAYDVGGISDWCDDGSTGHLVASGDIEWLGSSLEHLLDEPNSRRIMGLNAWHRAETDWSEQRHIERLLADVGPVTRKSRQ